MGGILCHFVKERKRQVNFNLSDIFDKNIHIDEKC